MFEDEMGGEMSEEERREVLKKREVMEWGVNCRISIKAV